MDTRTQRIVLGLIVALIVLQVIERVNEDLAWGYVGILLLGLLVVENNNLQPFYGQLSARLGR